MTLYQDFSNLADSALEALEARREEIGRELQEAFRILRALKGKNVSLEEFMSFWAIDEKPEFEKKAILTWLEGKKTGVPLTPGREHLAVPLPEDARDLWESLQAVREKTADPLRYWNEESGRFFGLPVDEEEAEKIRARYLIYAHSEEHLSALRLLEDMTALINFSNRYRSANVTPNSLETSAPWLAKMCVSKKVKHPRYDSYIFEFQPDKSFFCVKGDGFRAFDEDAISYSH